MVNMYLMVEWCEFQMPLKKPNHLSGCQMLTLKIVSLDVFTTYKSQTVRFSDVIGFRVFGIQMVTNGYCILI